MSLWLRALACAAVFLAVVGRYHRQALEAREDAALARAELAAIRMAQAAADAANAAREHARAVNEAREREHAQALDAICGADDLPDDEFFRALDGLLRKAGSAPSAPDTPRCGPAGGLRSPAAQ